MIVKMQITKMEYASYLSYTPRPKSEEQCFSKDVTRMLKNNEMWRGTLLSAAEHIVWQMARKVESSPLRDFFRGKPILVPMPSSSLQKPNSLWVPRCISSALVRNNLGTQVVECLSRVHAVSKSSRSLPRDRPRAINHYDSLGVETVHEADEILIIDDVITRGANMMGAVNRLAAVFPSARIRGFAIMRTVSRSEDFKAIEDPRTGFIRLEANGETFRRP